MVNKKLNELSDGEFTELVENSSSTADLLRTLGYSVAGNSWAYNIIADRMNRLKITFKQRYVSKSCGKSAKMPLSEILTTDSNYNRSNLRKRLFEEGVKEERCEICGITEWMGKPVTLQLHHLNGIHNDNRLSNLQILCPNCHSQTENFGTKGKGSVIRRKCESLPDSDKKLIMQTVSELGIVNARKTLPYRNSLINAIVKQNKEILVMVYPDGKTEKEFSTRYEAAKFLYEEFGIGSNEESSKSGISRVLTGRQQSIKGFTFYKRSVTE